MTDSSIVDTWVVAEDNIAMATNVVDGVKFVILERIIKMGDGAPEMAVMPFARGDELDRLIARCSARQVKNAKRN